MPGVTVEVNKEKPRKGAFVVTVGGKTVLELLDMKRPFPALKALDMEDVAKDAQRTRRAPMTGRRINRVGGRDPFLCSSVLLRETPHIFVT